MNTRYLSILIFVFGACLVLFLPTLSLAQDIGNQAVDKAEIKFFYTQTCHYCARAKEFLNGLQKKYPEVEVKSYDLFKKESIESLKELYGAHEVPKYEWGIVPAIFTKERYFVGFNEEIAQEIEGCVESCLAGGQSNKDVRNKISLPLIGEVDALKHSLPALAVILGFFDGFNVCSLGALVLILGLVLAAKSRKKILVFGGIFIGTTAAVYGSLIMVWYHIFALFAPYLTFMKVLIGLLGVGGGVYFLTEFVRFRKQGAVCDSKKGGGIVSRFSLKLKNLLDEGGSVIAVLFAVLLFAAAITIIEFPCSAAVPVFFAGLLAQAGHSFGYQFSLIALYLLFYVLDELVVFLVAFFTMSIRLTSNRFVVWITLLESIVLFLLGFYYLLGFLVFR